MLVLGIGKILHENYVDTDTFAHLYYIVKLAKKLINFLGKT